MRARSGACVAAFVGALLSTGHARADDKLACANAYQQAQELRDAHKLLESREQLRICARPTCAAFVVKDCTTWLADVESRIARVVLVAKSPTGDDVFDVKVSMDGAEVATKLEGRSIEVNPGEHTFVFEAKDGTRVERHVAVTEGAKDQRVEATLTAAAPAVQPPVPLPTPLPPTTTPPPGSPSPPNDQPRPSGTLRYVGYGALGVGGVGLVVGTVFGVLAISSKSSAHCNGADQCAALNDITSAQHDATAANVGFIAGGVLAAGGLGLLIFGTSRAPESRTGRIDVTPMVSPSTGGLSVRGAWW